LKKIKPEAAAKLIPLDNMLVRITQQDVVYRRYLDPAHRAFIPDFGVYIQFDEGGKTSTGRYLVNWSCSAWSGARPGACCNPRPVS